MKELESVRAGCVTEHGTLINSGEYDGLDFEQAFEAITARFEQAGTGSRRGNFCLRDWGVSRQRSSGCPHPVYHFDKCVVVPVAGAQLRGWCWPSVGSKGER